MWHIGKVAVENRIVAAPLAGISNPVYRKMCREYGAGLTVSEMISDKALHYENKKPIFLEGVSALLYLSHNYF